LVEEAVLKNFMRLFNFGDGDGLFCPGGSASNMNAMALARFKRFPEVKTKGLNGLPQMVAFTSEDVNSIVNSQKG
jgi:glutamate/tyrosine decarboxylase-like PLP-dependent enzyme